MSFFSQQYRNNISLLPCYTLVKSAEHTVSRAKNIRIPAKQIAVKFWLTTLNNVLNFELYLKISKQVSKIREPDQKHVHPNDKLFLKQRWFFIWREPSTPLFSKCFSTRATALELQRSQNCNVLWEQQLLIFKNHSNSDHFIFINSQISLKSQIKRMIHS